MGKLSNNQKGFGAVEGLLIIVIVVMISGMGWYVYKSLRDTNNAYSSATTTSSSTAPKFSKFTKKPITSTTAQQAYSYSGWKAYTTSFGFSFKYPADWVIGTYANNSGVTVSTVTNPVPALSGTQEPRPQYNNNLVLSLYDNPYHSNHASSNSEVLQTNFAMNGTAYCLVGDHNSATADNPITKISVNVCTAYDKTSWTAGVPVTKGAVEMGITSVGDGGAATVAISQANSEYATIKLILESMKF